MCITPIRIILPYWSCGRAVKSSFSWAKSSEFDPSLGHLCWSNLLMLFSIGLYGSRKSPPLGNIPPRKSPPRKSPGLLGLRLLGLGLLGLGLLGLRPLTPNPNSNPNPNPNPKGGLFLRGTFPRGDISRGEFSGGNFPGGTFPDSVYICFKYNMQNCPRQLGMKSCALCLYVRCGTSNHIYIKKQKLVKHL